MENSKEDIQRLLAIHRECLLAVEEQIARVGMNPPIELLQQRSHREKEITRLELELEEISGEDFYSKSLSERIENNTSFLVNKELRDRIVKIREFKDTASKIRETVKQNTDLSNELPISFELYERFSYLYAETAPFIVEVLNDLGFDKSQISDSILKFLNSSPSTTYNFLLETNQGLAFIQMALRRYEMMEKLE